MNFLTNKRIFITGCCGTVGAELLSRLNSDEFQPLEIVGLDNYESGLFYLEQRYVGTPNTSFFLGDVRDYQALNRLMRNIDVVFHTAALKHVSLCERAPFDAVQSNIQGVQNVAQAAAANGVECVLFTSSDKAVNPTNVMGTSKLMGERLITAANNTRRGSGPVLGSTRFGNVLGSSGSVVPVFRRQIAAGGPVTLTDPRMTRFVMTIGQAASLVLESAELVRGGEVFITKMPVIRIEDLARVMIRELAPIYGHDPAKIETEIIGTKPGEKLYEELMSEEETRRAMELENYFAVLPAYRGIYQKIDYSYDGVVRDTVSKPYNSSAETPMSEEELTRFMHDSALLDDGDGDRQLPPKRFWPGD
ncbi:MAG: polysaccharide biosynthesis protein [Gammaproteobacteria bacterium]|nr:polysaccharide biosynthesis protein [Gammaproteobacteria bacterium]MDH3768544.1 polysaccharide biosynthesis protein [Gammaproteobacteria bacterium]